MPENAVVSQVLLEIGQEAEEQIVTVSQGLLEIAYAVPESMTATQVLIEVGFIRTGRYAGPAVQHV